MAAITQGDVLLLRFRSDPGHVHMRYVMSRQIHERYYAFTPDRARMAMNLSGAVVVEMWLNDPARPDRVPAGFRADTIYRDSNSPFGDFTEEEDAHFRAHEVLLAQ